MSDTSRFIATVLQDRSTFEEQFKNFSIDDQSAFIDVLAELASNGILALKAMPDDLRLESVCVAVSCMSDDVFGALLTIMAQEGAH